jgi:hypothetical protein
MVDRVLIVSPSFGESPAHALNEHGRGAVRPVATVSMSHGNFDQI